MSLLLLFSLNFSNRAYGASVYDNLLRQNQTIILNRVGCTSVTIPIVDLQTQLVNNIPLAYRAEVNTAFTNNTWALTNQPVATNVFSFVYLTGGATGATLNWLNTSYVYFGTGTRFLTFSLNASCNIVWSSEPVGVGNKAISSANVGELTDQAILSYLGNAVNFNLPSGYAGLVPEVYPVIIPPPTEPTYKTVTDDTFTIVKDNIGFTVLTGLFLASSYWVIGFAVSTLNISKRDIK